MEAIYTLEEATNALRTLRGFMGVAQRSVVGELAHFSEEKQHFRDILNRLAHTVLTMPKTYEQDGKGDEATVYLHYFTPSADFYITEKDMGAEQIQAFGLACMGWPEMGYISIEEILAAGAELDFYFEPCTLREIKAKAGAA